MKFVCDRCQTKYSIADDKVRGKILKVRCKSCANIITVREEGARKPSSPASRSGVPPPPPVRRPGHHRRAPAADAPAGAPLERRPLPGRRLRPPMTGSSGTWRWTGTARARFRASS